LRGSDNPRRSRDETYSKALAELVNAQSCHPFAAHWGDGTTSSSDGQRFKVGGKAESTGHINPKYGEPGRTFYTHLSDQYAPYNAKAVNVGVRDATYVLDGLLYHESDLRIEGHYTDTAGFTDHVFALMHLLSNTFAIRPSASAPRASVGFADQSSFHKDLSSDGWSYAGEAPRLNLQCQFLCDSA
jgi:TnpA family transposase